MELDLEYQHADQSRETRAEGCHVPGRMMSPDWYRRAMNRFEMRRLD